MPRWRPVDGRRIGLVLPEPAIGGRLTTAVRKDHREVRNNQRAGYRDSGQPAQVVDEHQDCDQEAYCPDAHHDQVAALAVSNILRQAAARLGHEVSLILPPGGFHPSTVCCRPRCGQLGFLSPFPLSCVMLCGTGVS